MSGTVRTRTLRAMQTLEIIFEALVAIAGLGALGVAVKVVTSLFKAKR